MKRRAGLALLALLGACRPSAPAAPANTPLTPATHARFLISSGVHAVDCNQCHGATESFRSFSCVGCHAHEQAATDGVHGAVPPVLGTYSYASAACYSCHQSDDGKRHSFSHTGIANGCALCHSESASFAALPVAGFTHQPIGAADCSSCHTSTNWQTSAVPVALASDPARSLTVTAQVPTWSGTSIATVIASPELLPMPMLHGSLQLDPAAMSACSNCHVNAGAGSYYPGDLHASLTALGSTQPKACSECHSASAPAGFIGPTGTQPPRSPASGEMRHDAVAWSGETQTSTRIVTQDCAVCHLGPAPGATAPWRAGTGPAAALQFHASLTRGDQAQPASCNDCHANNRPTLLTSANAAGLPPGLRYDHTIAPAQADCSGCHTGGTTFSSWAQGRYHHAGDAAPKSCLPCHGGERPSATINPTSNWKSATYTAAPFDYLTNAQGIAHGNGNDCAACHTGPGTGAWGSTQNWAGGAFPHGASTDAASTCVACHASQRPDLQPGTVGSTAATVLGFDHSINGQGDCFGCHQATAAAATYRSYPFPGGDWKNGQAYPGANLIGSASQFVTTTEFTLLRTSPSNPALITGVSSLSATLYNQFLHTSAAVPAVFGLSLTPDTGKCWHCHANDGAGKVTSFSNGQFHPSLNTFTATPGGAVAPLAQPTGRCTDCHTQRPANIVEKPVGTPPVPSELQPMDHGALFVAAVSIGGVTASGVSALECSTCHARPGDVWTDGTFHKNIGAAVPKDCTGCHYQLMADAAASNKTSGSDFAMKHASAQVTLQSCQTCHTGALAQAGTSPVSAALWSGGALHAKVPVQPTACLDCHSASAPAATTASTIGYTMPLGGSATNGAQWMSHAAPAVAGQECARCHLADAKASGSAWSKSDTFHPQATPATCQGCHGLGNGSSAAGLNNNLPVGLTNSSTLTTASDDPATGIPTGTFDQLTHSDANVASRECNACHTQAGVSKTGGVQGKEWAQAAFHANFNGAVPLLIDGAAGRCSNCHMNVKPTATFTAFDHSGLSAAPGSVDCVTCHQAGSSWLNSVVPTAAVSDKAHDLTVNALVPSWSGTSISTVAAQAETLPMPMFHSSTAIDTRVFDACSNCHVNAAVGAYYPGALHSALSTLKLAQPSACATCHAASAPTGFVGPATTAPPRTPQTGEMKHDAVVWTQETKTQTPLVTQDCGVCHVVPAAGATAPWTIGTGTSAALQFHASLTRAALAQPASCNDCHANTRPAQLTSANAALPAGLRYDHTIAPAQADCTACHVSAAAVTSWTGGRFHHAGDKAPASCLPCHSGERPSATVNPTSAWKSTTYLARPFDYLTNAQGIAHGNGDDCATCHNGPGTGAWGSTQNWVGGAFSHAATTDAASTCVACHASQRPDLQPGTVGSTAATVLAFDHAQNGSGDCIGCHQATVQAGSYVQYTFPGGDWKGGQGYPGSSLVGSINQFVTTTEFTLLRSAPANPGLVTGVSSLSATLYNQFLHTSSAIPAAFGLSATPDTTRCWHCHSNDGNGHVTSFADGQFHPSLNTFKVAPASAVTPLAQPTAQCADCHTVRPINIVEKPVGAPLTPSELQPMDHSALFTSAVTIRGVVAGGAAALDCSTCHSNPGNAWTDGSFHKNVGAAVPSDCTACHYQVMADASAANKASGALYAMKHGSAQLTLQNCQACHAAALAKGATTPVAATLFSGGLFHGAVPAQPTACADCHAVSLPAAATQSSVAYAFAAGGTSSNGAQWMNHASQRLSGLDCDACHATDAKASGSAWSKSDSFHAKATSPGTCQECHGTANGSGSAPGTGNNLPAGLTDSSTLTTASNDSTTGVPAGTHDQLSHADINVSARDCGFCHTQAGASSVAGTQGKEWAQAGFHSHFSGTVPLDMTNGRCSNCHLNVKPGATFTAYNHSALGATGQDCSACHAPPPGRSDWLGAAGAPAYITVGGFAVSQPPATAATTEPGVANLPHPAASTCATCHTGGTGGTSAVGYDHLSSLISAKCNSCHEAGSNLLGVLWNGTTVQASGAGDTRPFTIAPLTPSICNKAIASPGPHFYPSDCSLCHKLPAGTGTATTGAAYKAAWKASHPPKTGSTSSPPCSICHSNGCGDN